MVGKCLFCLSEGVKLVKAHIIPRSFFEVTRGSGKYAVGFVLTKETVETPYEQAGLHDEGILGECCEPKFTEWDTYGFENLREQTILAHRALPDAGSDRPGAFKIRNLDYDTFSLFILSVLWRASVSTHLFFSNVDLGPKAESIRQLLLARRAPDPDSYSIILATTRDEKYRKVIPRPERGRMKNVNFYRLYFPDVFALVKVDKRTFPPPLNSVILRRVDVNYV